MNNYTSSKETREHASKYLGALKYLPVIILVNTEWFTSASRTIEKIVS